MERPKRAGGVEVSENAIQTAIASDGALERSAVAMANVRGRFLGFATLKGRSLQIVFRPAFNGADLICLIRIVW